MTFASEFLAPIVWTTMTIGQEVLIVTTQSPWSVLPTTIGLRRRTWKKVVAEKPSIMNTLSKANTVLGDDGVFKW